MLHNLKIRTRLLLTFTVLIAFILIVGIVGIIRINAISKNSRDVYYMNVSPIETLEKVKSDFAELRRLINATLLYTTTDDTKHLEASIAETRKQYTAVQISCEEHAKRLRSSNSPQNRIDAINNVLNQITSRYWVEVEKIFEKALDGNTKMTLEHVAIASAIGVEINELIVVPFASNMTEAAANTDKISVVSNNAMLILLVVCFIALVFSIFVSIYLSTYISKRIHEIKIISDEISAGNLSIKINDGVKDELGELSESLSNAVKSIDGIMSAIRNLSGEMQKGNIHNKIDSNAFKGVYKSVADDVSDFFEATLNDTFVFMDCMTEFANGNFNATIPQFPGDKVIMNEIAEKIRGKLKSVVQEVSILVDAAINGKLDSRSDINLYSGGWMEIMEGLNRLMEAVSMPISESVDVLAQAANGNMKDIVKGNYLGDFQKMKSSINIMITNMDSYITEVSDVLGAVSNDELDRIITREYVGQFSKIKDAINSIINKFNTVIGDISSAASQVAAGSKQISESGMNLAQGSSEQASSVQQLSATIQMINDSTSKNAENARKVSELSTSSMEFAIKGESDMINMLNSMDSIKDSSNNISKIIKTIDDIAVQTNLLAINATIEAARAGLHGKGFAVVADEVRILAGKSQSAAKETANLIEESISRVAEGTKVADKTASTLHTIVNDVTAASNVLNGIAAASADQAVAIEQVSEGISQIAEVVQANSSTAEEAASAAQELSSQSELLRNMVKVFKLKKSKNW